MAEDIVLLYILQILKARLRLSQVSPSGDDDEEVFGIVTDEIVVKLRDVHETIRTYTKYAIGAFKSLPDVEVEELNLKFGLKVGGKTGIPMLTEGSAETNFEIEVKLTFPK